MAFDIDVLITFAEKDNEVANKSELGWVSQFKRFLELMLNQVLGEKSKILMKAEYDNITAPDLKSVGVLVTVLSKDFVESGAALDHVEAFYKTLENSPKRMSRVFKVFKTPLTPQEQPPRLRDLIGYEMYQFDIDSGEVSDYKDYFSTEAERQYWMKMVDLAYDIFDTLIQLKQEAGREAKNLFKRKTIYLAETGHDLSVQRNIIKRELQRHGYLVLPNQTLPDTVSEMEKLVERDLAECNLSIHLIGSAYGEIPKGSDRSVVDIQNKLAAEKSVKAQETKEDFTRLIWISPILNNASERQKGFIENIKRDVEGQDSAEILQTPLEDFKNIMREELLDTREKKNTTEDLEGRSIYLMHDRVDINDVKPIMEVLEKSGYRVLIPAFEGELLEVRKKHIDNLRTFDAAIIYKGKVNEQWVRMKALDLLKAPGFGRKKPILGKAIVARPGSSLNLETFKGQNVRIIESDPSRSAESIKSLLQEFNA